MGYPPAFPFTFAEFVSLPSVLSEDSGILSSQNFFHAQKIQADAENGPRCRLQGDSGRL